MSISSEQLSKWATMFKEPLAEIDAQLFEQLQATYVSLLGDAELPRHWPELSLDQIPSAIDYLNLCTSVKNSVPCKYVDDPMANGEVYEGRWRQAFIRRVMQGEVTKLVQVLRKGYAETINWDEARIRIARWLQDQPTGTTSDYERYIEVYWPNCSISKLEAMANSLNARTYPDPTIENEVRAGTWRNVGVTTSKADDGSGIVTMSLAISHFRLDAFTNWLTGRNEEIVYLWGYGKDEAQAVIDAWKAKGHGATVAYRKDEGLIDLVLRSRDYDQVDVTSQTSSWDCRYKQITDYHFGVSDPEAYPLTTTPADGVSYDRQLRDNGDGSWDILVITRQVQYRDIPFQTSRISGMLTTETRQQLGLTTQTPEPMVLESGKVKEQRVEVRDDCSKDVLTNKDTPTRVSVNEYLARQGDGELEYRSEEYHDPNVPDVTKYKDSEGVEQDVGTTESAAILHHELDDFLTHNYKKSRTVKSFPFEGEKTWKVWGDKEVVTSQAYSETLGRYWNDHSYVYHLYAEHTLQYYNTVDDAIAFIHDDNGWDGSTLIDSGGSGWTKTDEFQYLAHKVRNKKSLIATYNYQEPLA
jgi:hypothetical protein